MAKNGRIFLWKFANARSFFDFSWGGVSQNAHIISSIIYKFWLITSVILILKCALKPQKNDVLETISSQISQNAPIIISSIISNFWSITIVILILKVALKPPKNDVLKTILSQIILRISLKNPPPPKLWKIPPPRKIEKPSRICKFSLEYTAFFAIFGVKNTLVNLSIFSFLDVILA